MVESCEAIFMQFACRGLKGESDFVVRTAVLRASYVVVLAHKWRGESLVG